MPTHLGTYQTELQQELERILNFWMARMVDEARGGFYGRIDHNNKVHKEAPKGAVLNSRMLWSFAAAYRHTGNGTYLAVADRVYHYIADCFIDTKWGGVYWTVNSNGQPLDTKKQIYALAFALYALSEYCLAQPSEVVLQQAIDLYKTIVAKSYDDVHGGYLEAFAQDWTPIADLRLSAKDFNEKKSMNTHLHLLEAFTNLYRVWPHATLKQKIEELLHLFLKHIISADTHHLILFFNEVWHPKSSLVSYGHDIEAAWLLQEAATVIGNATMLEKVKSRCMQITQAATRGLDGDGGLWYEWNPDQLHLVKEKHWWPQSEAMVGFFNAYQLSGDETFLNRSINSWRFIKKHILDIGDGEWHWGVTADYKRLQEDKAGLWKCPYHNSRACIEVVNRIQHISKLQKENETF